MSHNEVTPAERIAAGEVGEILLRFREQDEEWWTVFAKSKKPDFIVAGLCGMNQVLIDQLMDKWQLSAAETIAKVIDGAITDEMKKEV